MHACFARCTTSDLFDTELLAGLVVQGWCATNGRFGSCLCHACQSMRGQASLMTGFYLDYGYYHSCSSSCQICLAGVALLRAGTPRSEIGRCLAVSPPSLALCTWPACAVRAPARCGSLTVEAHAADAAGAEQRMQQRYPYPLLIPAAIASTESLQR
eukprot:6206622-Pleurochrysis_carterae.AAC.1